MSVAALAPGPWRRRLGRSGLPVPRSSGSQTVFPGESALRARSRASPRRRCRPPGVDVDDIPVPDSLGSLVAARVRALPARTRDELLRTAALARPDLRLVDAEALGAGRRGRARADPTRSSRRVCPPAVRVGGLRVGVDESSTPDAPRPHVARPRSRGTSAASRAVVRRAGQRWSLEELEAAARRARLRGAPNTAAEFVELALRHVPEDSPRVGELRLRLAEHLYLASDFQRAVAELEQLRRDARLGRSPRSGSADARGDRLLAQRRVRGGRASPSRRSPTPETRSLRPAVRCRSRCTPGRSTWPRPPPPPARRLSCSSRGSTRRLDFFAAALAARVRADLFLGDGFDAETAPRGRSPSKRPPHRPWSTPASCSSSANG